jgi:hypothetical protein
MTGLVADLDDHDTKVKQLQERRKANANATMMNETQQTIASSANQFDLNASRSIRGTEVGDESGMVPTKKRAKDKEEYERRKIEEEEMKRVLEEERQK